jgi:hypothetical protein
VRRLGLAWQAQLAWPQPQQQELLVPVISAWQALLVWLVQQVWLLQEPELELVWLAQRALPVLQALLLQEPGQVWQAPPAWLALLAWQVRLAWRVQQVLQQQVQEQAVLAPLVLRVQLA